MTIRNVAFRLFARLSSVAFCVVGVVACSTVDRPKPSELGPINALISITQVWSTSLPAVTFPVDVKVNGGKVYLAASDGTVVALDGATGRDVWRLPLGVRVAAGVGTDGVNTAVVTQANELIMVNGAKELWRQKINGMTLTSPVVAGERVFVLAADRTMYAFDGKTGRRLWQQQRSGDALVLAQAGILQPFEDTLLFGSSGRLIGVSPQNGQSLWDTSIASSRGSNEVERLVDLVAGASRVESSMCVRAYQIAVGCVDLRKGTTTWTKPLRGFSGIDGNPTMVVATEANGQLIALRRDNGDKLWTSDKLLHRKLSAPLLVGKTIVVGDETGAVYFFSRDTGELTNRMVTNAGPISATPVVVGQTVVVVTQRGNVFGFRPE
ncbi:outer membrane protein assembly factor BamB [Rhodoferax aquaticus]|uniref:Outer membrane protein assembly factor BamB n=1 Tax=Rhodoferax aquaticus TaxID=2527691 RepID=A0A515EQ28_9BURK|nr:outer membrane protein assembly factor BamB [Rhodoferax aquaticus]QDL54730.1 outer membrane protein assembly factor BamB [Rhodoferax aquaticus]